MESDRSNPNIEHRPSVDPSCPFVLRFERAYQLYLEEAWEEALRELEALIQDSPTHPNAAWLRAGLLRRIHGDSHPDVLTAYDFVVSVEPDNAYAQIERADILRVLERHAEARDIYALYADPQRYVSQQTASPERQQRESTAWTEAERMEEREAENPNLSLCAEANFKLGCVALVLQDLELARNAFQTLLALDPTYPDAAEMLALSE